MTKSNDEAATKHRIPVIERMVEVFAMLERTPQGATTRAVSALTGLSRTTVYRMLNTLYAHDFVSRSPAGEYKLGQRLLTLATRVPPHASGYDLLVIAQPQLEKLSEATGQGSKVSVVAGGEILVVAAAQGGGQYALTTSPGQRLPIHAGAAGKMLLAHLPRRDLDLRLNGKLPALTATTIVEPKRMLAELARIRRRGWSSDEGEQMSGVHAIAAPIRDQSNTVIAAVSVPFVAGVEQVQVDEIRRLAIFAAEAISGEIARTGLADQAKSGATSNLGRKPAIVRSADPSPTAPRLRGDVRAAPRAQVPAERTQAASKK